MARSAPLGRDRRPGGLTHHNGHYRTQVGGLAGRAEARNPLKPPARARAPRLDLEKRLPLDEPAILVANAWSTASETSRLLTPWR